MAGGWPSRIVGRLVGLRGGTARQSRLRSSVLGSAASRCVDFPSLPHSHTAFSVVPTFSSLARSLDSRHFTSVTRSSISSFIFVSRFARVRVASRPRSLLSRLCPVLRLSPRAPPSRSCFFSIFSVCLYIARSAIRFSSVLVLVRRSGARPARRTM